MKNEIKSIQYLRCLAAIAVVLFHYRIILNDYNQFNVSDLGDILFSNGNFGVDLFFIISGYVITMSTQKDESRFKNTLSFILKRIFRIYPILILFTIIAAIIVKPNILYTLRSLIPLHANYDSTAPYFGYNLLLVSWTLTYELFFYFIFAISMFINHKYRGGICVLIIMLMYLTIQLAYLGKIQFDVNTTIMFDYYFLIQPVFSLSSSPMFLEFGLGILCYYICNFISEHRNIISNVSLVKPILICIILSALSLLICNSILSGHGVAGWGWISFIFILSAVSYEKIYSIKQIKAFKFLGDISYSIYMSHILLLSPVIFIGQIFYIKGFSLLFIALLFVVFLSSISYYLIEKPFSNLCRFLLKK